VLLDPADELGVQRSFPDDGIDLEFGSRGVFAATTRSR
jgi:hypothetical protein